MGGRDARITVCSHEADELENHDQRTGRGLGHAETIQHLSGLQPSERVDSLLCDVGQDGVRAAERHHGHFREEHGDLAEDVAGPQDRQQAGPPERSRA